MIGAIERRVGERAAAAPGSAGRQEIRLAVSSRTPVARMVLAILRDYPQRAVLGLVLMAAQAFFYNAIFFSYALVLTRFYGVPAASVGWYILPFALGNFVGPLVLGPLFDLRRPQADDRRHLCALGRAAGDRRLAVPRRPARAPRS